MFHNLPWCRTSTSAERENKRFPALAAALVIMIAAATTDTAAADAQPLLTTTVIDGSTVYSAAELFSAYRDQIGQPISHERTQAIIASLAELYRRDGFARPEIRVDHSLSASGILRVSVAEPRITRVTITGAVGHHREELERIAAAIRGSQPLRRDAVQAAMRRMRELPGLTLTASTKRDETIPNGYQLLVQADFAPIEGVVRMNNRGTEQVGRAFMLGQVIVNDWLGWKEKLGVFFSAATETDEYLGVGMFLDTPVNEVGTRAMTMVFRSESAPHESPVNLPDEYTRERATLRVTHPMKREGRWNWSVSAALDAEDLSIDRDGSQVRDDRLRVLEAGGRFAWRQGEATQCATTLELRQGLDSLGAGLQADDMVVDRRRGDFLLAQVQASSVTRLNDAWSLRVDGFLQHTGYVLPDSERFKIGGDRLGRGFEVAEIAGDQGAGAKLELRRELGPAGTFFGRMSAYGFYDLGAVWKQDQPGRESAATAGTGIAMQGARLNGYLEVAKPLTHPDVEGKRDATLFAELSFRF
jgi:hemolysin activation/secretion protein